MLHVLFFFFNDTATTEIYTLSLHDALPILSIVNQREVGLDTHAFHNALKNAMREAPDVILIGEILDAETMEAAIAFAETRSEEHTSELQSQSNLVCRLLLEKKKNNKQYMNI